MSSAEQFLYQTEKSSHRRFSIKTLSLKICNIDYKTPARNYSSNLSAAASELTLISDYLELCFWIAFKTILTQ